MLTITFLKCLKTCKTFVQNIIKLIPASRRRNSLRVTSLQLLNMFKFLSSSSEVNDIYVPI